MERSKFRSVAATSIRIGIAGNFGGISVLFTRDYGDRLSRSIAHTGVSGIARRIGHSRTQFCPLGAELGAHERRIHPTDIIASAVE